MKSSSNWIGAIIVAVILVSIFSIVNNIERAATKNDYARILARGYHLCPPPGPGLSNSLVMVIETTADDRPTVTGCVRIAERKFGPQLRKPAGTVQKMALK